MRIRLAFKIWFVIVNAFWIAVWLQGLLPGAPGAVRVEDVVTVVALACGIVLELCNLRAARLINIWFYVVYALVPLMLAIREPDVHAVAGVVWISVPYLLIGIANFCLYRSLDSRVPEKVTMTNPG